MTTRKKKNHSVRVALATLPPARNLDDGTRRVLKAIQQCGRRGVEIVCFAETYLPGLRIPEWHVKFGPPDQPRMDAAMERIRAACRKHRVAAIVGLEWVGPRGLENRAMVIGRDGRLLGHQTKNQITPDGESDSYVCDGKRRVFKVGHLTFGVVICHEGWRYPETVRWAAVRGAQVVFQPQVTGSETGDFFQPHVTGSAKKWKTPQRWGEAFYEKAMQCRAAENAIYFASVNVAMRHQNSATSLIGPSGDRIASVPYGRAGLLVRDLDLSRATRLYAKRFQPKLYPK